MRFDLWLWIHISSKAFRHVSLLFWLFLFLPPFARLVRVNVEGIAIRHRHLFIAERFSCLNNSLKLFFIAHKTARLLNVHISRTFSRAAHCMTQHNPNLIEKLLLILISCKSEKCLTHSNVKLSAQEAQLLCAGALFIDVIYDKRHEIFIPNVHTSPPTPSSPTTPRLNRIYHWHCVESLFTPKMCSDQR